MRGGGKGREKPISQIPLERTWHCQQVDFLPWNLLQQKRNDFWWNLFDVFLPTNFLAEKNNISQEYYLAGHLWDCWRNTFQESIKPSKTMIREEILCEQISTIISSSWHSLQGKQSTSIRRLWAKPNCGKGENCATWWTLNILRELPRGHNPWKLLLMFVWTRFLRHMVTTDHCSYCFSSINKFI